MKILIDAHSFDESRNEGMTTYLRGLYTAMVGMAPDIQFYFAARDTGRLHTIFGEGSGNTYFLQLEKKSRTRRLFSEFPELIRRHKIDLAHFQYLAPPFRNCRTIVTLHDLLFLDFPKLFPSDYRISRKLTFGYTARQADLLATVSDYSRQRISKHYNIPADRIVVTPNAVSRNFFDFKADQETLETFRREKGLRRYILNVSRAEPRKNQAALLEAYLRLRLASRGYDLVFIASPALPVPEFHSLLNSAPREDRRHIHLVDNVDHPRIPLWYAAADLFVFPSLAEGFGIPPIEAAALRVPTICNRATAMSEFSFLADNLADLSDPDTLCRLIDRNLSDPPSPDALEEISRQVARRYNWRSSAETLLASLKKFC